MAVPSQRLTGMVMHRPVALGSKSERRAVVLRTQSGGEYILRRMGGNAFKDEELEGLVGSSITADGQVAGQTFIMKAWNIDKGAKR